MADLCMKQHLGFVAEQVKNKTLQLVSHNWLTGRHRLSGGYLQVLGGNGSQWPVEVTKRRECKTFWNDLDPKALL